MKLSYLAAAGAALALSTSAMANSFVNGGFENGNTTGWDVQSSKSRTSVTNGSLNPGFFSSGVNAGARSAVINSSYVDPNLGSKIGSTVYSGNFGYRVEDTTSGGYASLIQQRVDNYTDANIFFAWKSVLEGAHGVNDAATMIITLTNATTGAELIRRVYNAASTGGGVDSRFTYDNATNLYYTAQWQIEQLDVSAFSGDSFILSVIAADCQPAGHEGYVYLDGFGAVAPPPVDPGAVPEPATWAMMIGGFGMIGASLRNRRRKVSVSFA